jgi:hypothetical protein
MTRIRDQLPRSERERPEAVLCRCEFPDRETALRAADSWATVRNSRERVKMIALDASVDRPSAQTTRAFT